MRRNGEKIGGYTIMGSYDSVLSRDLSKEGQVKCWDCAMAIFRIGDTVPPLDNGKRDTTYSIMMREGGAINVIHGIYESWTEKPLCLPVYDKYGDTWVESDMYLFHTKAEEVIEK